MLETIFIKGVLLCSVLTALIVEAIKKMMDKENRPTNLIAAGVSVIVGLIVGISYIVLNNLEFTSASLISLGALILASWISSMVGFDKFKQTIEQVLRK